MAHSRVTTPQHPQVTQPILYSATDYYGRTGHADASPRADDHEFFAQICVELMGQAEVVVAANSDGVRNFQNFVQVHAPRLASIMSYEIAADLDDGQFAVFTRETSSDN